MSGIERRLTKLEAASGHTAQTVVGCAGCSPPSPTQRRPEPVPGRLPVGSPPAALGEAAGSGEGICSAILRISCCP
jgi:hypothetical protein